MHLRSGSCLSSQLLPTLSSFPQSGWLSWPTSSPGAWVGVRGRAGRRGRKKMKRGTNSPPPSATISGTRFQKHVSSWRSLWGFLTIEKKTEREGGGREKEKSPQKGHCLTSFHCLVCVNLFKNRILSLCVAFSPLQSSCPLLLCISFRLFLHPTYLLSVILCRDCNIKSEP